MTRIIQMYPRNVSGGTLSADPLREPRQLAPHLKNEIKEYIDLLFEARIRPLLMNWLTESQAMKKLRVGERTLKLLVFDNIINCCKIGHIELYDPVSIDTFLNDQKKLK